jgi:hypothetical protein
MIKTIKILIYLKLFRSTLQVIIDQLNLARAHFLISHINTISSLPLRPVNQTEHLTQHFVHS